MQSNVANFSDFAEPRNKPLEYFYGWMQRTRDYTIMMLRRPVSSHRYCAMEEAMIANALKKVFVLKLPRDREPMEIDEMLPWESTPRR